MKFPEDVAPKLLGSNAHSDTKENTRAPWRGQLEHAAGVTSLLALHPIMCGSH